MTEEERLAAEKVAADQAAADKAKADADAAAAANDPAKAAADKKVQDELDAARAELKKLQDAEDARKNAELSEVEREKKAREAAEAEVGKRDALLRDHAIERGITAAAREQKLDLDESAIEVLQKAGEFNGIKVVDGKAVGIGDHLKELVKSRPFVLKAKPAAPDLGADRKGDEKDGQTPGALTDDRKSDLKKRYRL